MNSFLEGIATIALGIVGLAVVAVLVSRKSNTAGVMQSMASGLANNIGVAISPVTGSSPSFNVSYPSSGFGGFGS